MKKTITFSVPGIPVPLGRPRTTRNMPGVYDDPKSKKAKSRFRAIAKTYAPDEPLVGPLSVKLVFCFERPKGHFGTGRNAGIVKASAPRHNTVKPDIDNLSKLVLDALNGLCYVDDAQVVSLNTEKIYSANAQTIVFIKPVNHQDTESTEESE